MEWQQIVGFHQVAKLKSFTRAAEATFRTQSALSQQVKALEAELACQLFERVGKRKLRLTMEGECFLKFAESVLQSLEWLKEELEELKGSQRGHLRIAAPFTTLYHLFPQVIEEYASRFPGVELTLLDRPQDSVIDLVGNGDVDFGFALETIVPQRRLLAIRWKKVETVLMAPSAHPLCSEIPLSFERIGCYPLILPPHHPKNTGRILLEEEFKKRGQDYRISMESSNIELSSVYVEMGLGISLATIVRDIPVLKERKLVFLPLGHPFEPDHIALVMRKDITVASHKKAFMRMLLGESAPKD
jgi:DNA-binding transcriptional LysR family regulator